MNNKRKINFLIISLILILTNMMYGCKNNTEDKENIDSININSGSIAIENDSYYKIYNLSEGIYKLIDTDKVITVYDSKSNNYIFNKNGEFKVDYLGVEKLIDTNNNIYSINLAPSGEYLSYFVKDEYLQLKIKELKTDKYINFDSKVSISGELISWYNNEALVYYGIDNEKNNGIFTYNVSSNTEKLIYKLDSGYVEYLKVLDNGIVFVQEKEGKERTLKIINEKGELVDTITNIIDIIDVEYTKDKIYILGKMENNNYSLYEYYDKNIKRLIYDFPKIINLEKGLSKDPNGNILFIGGDEPDIDRVYICEDGFISKLSEIDGDYNFIEYK